MRATLIFFCPNGHRQKRSVEDCVGDQPMCSQCGSPLILKKVEMINGCKKDLAKKA